MVDFLLQVGWETWVILKEASLFLLFGFAIAGVLGVVVPSKALMRFFGTGKVKSVMWASALGVPLPLCSCGVLPTAIGLRKQGATKGATVSFLVSTPETGVDSIGLTYALMDPIITVFRPVVAMITAVSAGLATNFFGEPRRKKDVGAPAEPSPADQAAIPETGDHLHDHQHDHSHDFFDLAPEPEAGEGAARPIAARVMAKAREVYRYAFRTLFDEMSYWLVLGIVLSGVVAAALPQTFFERYLTGEFTSMLAMLLIGIPIYTCASSSTPIAAALVLKGLDPGAALVFLLSGPATNIGSIIVLLKFLGARIVAIYLASIVVITLLAGFTLNWVYRYWELDAQATFGTGTEFLPEWVKIAGAVTLIALLMASMWRSLVPGEWVWLRDKLADRTGVALSAGRLRTATAAAVGLLYLSTGLFAVQPGEVGIKTTFGRITAADLGPGLHTRWPWPFEAHRVVPTALVRRVELGFRSAAATGLAERTLARKRLTVGGPSNPVPVAILSRGFWFQKEKVAAESFLLTGDSNLLDVSFTVFYRVRDAVAYAYALTDPEALVRSTTLTALRAKVATMGIDAIFTAERGAIEEQVAASVQGLLDSLGSGIELVSIRLLYVHPPEEVHSAFRDVASAQEDKIHIMNRAMTFAVQKVNLAEGDAAAMIEGALAFKDEKILRADGEATAFGLQVEEYERAPELTRFRLHMEAVEDVMPRLRKLLRPGARDINELDLWLLDPFAASEGR